MREYLLALLLILLSAQCITRNRNLLHFSPPYADSFAITSLWIQGSKFGKTISVYDFSFLLSVEFSTIPGHFTGSNKVISDVREETFHQLQPRRTLPKGKSAVDNISSNLFKSLFFKCLFPVINKLSLWIIFGKDSHSFSLKKVGIKNITHEAFHQQRP